MAYWIPWIHLPKDLVKLCSSYGAVTLYLVMQVPSQPPKTILIVGGTGYLGQFLVQDLAEKYKVRLLVI